VRNKLYVIISSYVTSILRIKLFVVRTAKNGGTYVVQLQLWCKNVHNCIVARSFMQVLGTERYCSSQQEETHGLLRDRSPLIQGNIEPEIHATLLKAMSVFSKQHTHTNIHSTRRDPRELFSTGLDRVSRLYTKLDKSQVSSLAGE
jgi:hypothetical protein